MELQNSTLVIVGEREAEEEIGERGGEERTVEGGERREASEREERERPLPILSQRAGAGRGRSP